MLYAVRMEKQDLSRMYLAHHELESVIIIISIMLSSAAFVAAMSPLHHPLDESA